MGKTKTISNLPTNRPRFAGWLALAWLAWGVFGAAAQTIITNVAAVNVTPSSFSVVWTVTGSNSSRATPSISVFADATGLTNLAGQLGVSFYPLHTGNPALTNSYDRRLNQASLREKTAGLGLVDVQLMGCAPNTKYYYQLQETDPLGRQTVWPAAGLLPAVTTAAVNDFVLDSLQLVLDVPGLDPSGTMVLLSNSNSPSLLAAIAGDGAASNQVYFNLSDLLAASGASNLLPVGTQPFTAFTLAASNSVSQNFSLSFSTNFLVGQGSQVSLGSYIALSLGSAILPAGSSGAISIGLYASAVTNLAFSLNVPTNRFSSLTLGALSSQVNSARLQVVGSNALLATLAAVPGQTLAGNQEIAQLSFTTVSNEGPVILALSPQSLSGVNADSSSVSNLAAQAGQLIIVANQPLLAATLSPPGVHNLSLYGLPGNSYEIQSSTNLNPAGGWSNLLRVPMTNLQEVFSGLDPTRPAIFYRAYQFQADPPLLEAHGANQTRSLLVYGIPGTNYVLQFATNLSGAVTWSPLLPYTLTNSFLSITNLTNANPVIFYRVARP